MGIIKETNQHQKQQVYDIEKRSDLGKENGKERDIHNEGKNYDRKLQDLEFKWTNLTALVAWCIKL